MRTFRHKEKAKPIPEGDPGPARKNIAEIFAEVPCIDVEVCVFRAIEGRHDGVCVYKRMVMETTMAKREALIPDGSMVYIAWVDSAGSDGWQEAVIDADTSACESCGFLVAQDKQFVLIAGSKATNSVEHNGTMQIPKTAIVKIRRVK